MSLNNAGSVLLELRLLVSVDVAMDAQHGSVPEITVQTLNAQSFVTNVLVTELA